MLPNAWLRLRRVGDVFTGFYSTDGVNWTDMGSISIALPQTVYFGLAVASKSNSNAATAQFRNLTEVIPQPPTVPPPRPADKDAENPATILRVGRSNDGRDLIIRSWVEGGFGSPDFGDMRCIATRANRQPAVMNYVRRAGSEEFVPFALDRRHPSAADVAQVVDGEGHPEQLEVALQQPAVDAFVVLVGVPGDEGVHRQRVLADVEPHGRLQLLLPRQRQGEARSLDALADRRDPEPVVDAGAEVAPHVIQRGGEQICGETFKWEVAAVRTVWILCIALRECGAR